MHILLTLCIIGFVGWAFCKFVGRPFLIQQDAIATEGETPDYEQALRESEAALEEGERKRDVLTDHVDVKQKLNRIETDVTRLEDRLNND